MSKQDLFNSIGKGTGNYLDGTDRAIEESNKHNRILDTYRFSELDEQVQERIVERRIQIYLASNHWYRPLIDGAIQILREAGIVAEGDGFEFDLNFDNDCRFRGKIPRIKALIQYFGLEDEYLKIADNSDPISIYVYKKKRDEGHAVKYWTTSPDDEDRLDQLFQDLEKKMTNFCRLLWSSLFYAYKNPPKSILKEYLISKSDDWFYSNGALVDSGLKTVSISDL